MLDATDIVAQVGSWPAIERSKLRGARERGCVPLALRILAGMVVPIFLIFLIKSMNCKCLHVSWLVIAGKEA